MKNLTSRQRYLKMFRGEKIDRIPICPRVFQNVVFEHFNTKDFKDAYLDKIAAYYREYNFDIIDWNCTPIPHFELTEFEKEGPQWKVTVSEEFKGSTRHTITTIQTPKGVLRRVLGTSVTGPWEEEVALVEYPIKTERDFDLIAEFMPPPYKPDCSSIKKMKRLIGDDGITSPSFHGPFNILGYCYRKPDDLLLDPLLYNDWYHRMMDFFLKRILHYTQHYIDAGADMLDFGTNIAGGTTVSPEFLVEHILPYENKLADFAQTQGVVTLYHNCGFAANHLGIYNQLHHRMWGYLAPKPHGDVVLEDVIRKVPREMILWGHIDQIDFLRQATPRQIEERVKYCCETMKPRGNYILGTTDYLEVNTPPENIRALVDAGLKYGQYA